MFEIRLGDKGEVVCEGRLDASQAAKAQAFLDALAAPDVVDMAKLEYISSAGLGVLSRSTTAPDGSMRPQTPTFFAAAGTYG